MAELKNYYMAVESRVIEKTSHVRFEVKGKTIIVD